MRRREFITLLGGMAVRGRSREGRQTAGKIPRIGWIILGSPAGSVADIFSYYDSFRAGLGDVGYVEGSNIVLVARSAEGVPERLPSLVDELLRENVSVVVSPGPAIRVVREKIKSIPVVFAFSGDPVAAGFVDTLSHGKENLTGLSYMAVELNGKRLDLMKEIFRPCRGSRCLRTRSILANIWRWRNPASCGRARHLPPVPSGANPAEFDAAFRAMSDSKTQGIVAVPDNLIMLERERLAEFAKDKRIPVISGWSEFAQSGGLMTYGPNSSKFFRRFAVYVKQDHLRREAQRNPDRAAHYIRAGDQPQNRQDDRPHNPSDIARPRRRGDRIGMLFAAVHESVIGTFENMVDRIE